jgi:glyoxylase I family protein
MDRATLSSCQRPALRSDRDELKAWQARLEKLGIPHGGIVDAHYGSSLSFRDPDNIALELFAPPG